MFHYIYACVALIVLAPSSLCLFITATYISMHSFMYLCVRCYYHTCLKVTGLRVGVKTLYNIIIEEKKTKTLKLATYIFCPCGLLFSLSGCYHYHYCLNIVSQTVLSKKRFASGCKVPMKTFAVNFDWYGVWKNRVLS